MANTFKLERYGWRAENGRYFVIDRMTNTIPAGFGKPSTKKRVLELAAELNTPAATAAYHAALAHNINHELHDIEQKALRAIENASFYQQAEGAKQLTLPLGRLREMLSLARTVKAHYAELETKLAAGEPLAEVKTAQSAIL
jgi:hypothetical protein